MKNIAHECERPEECHAFVCRDDRGFSCGKYVCEVHGGDQDNRCADCWSWYDEAFRIARERAKAEIAAGLDPSLRPKPWAIYSPLRRAACVRLGRCDCGECHAYRYALGYPANATLGLGIAVLIAANPSTATEHKPDPTVSRWIERCRRKCYAWACVANARAWRETDPKKLPPDPKAIEHSALVNDAYILELSLLADVVVCGWGKLGGEHAKSILDLLVRHGIQPHALKLNGDGTPAHPLYLRYDLEARPMEVDGGAR